MIKSVQKKAVKDAIGVLSASIKSQRETRQQIRETIAKVVKNEGGEVRFELPDDIRLRNSEAVDREVAAAQDEETRSFLRQWVGPLYGGAVREAGYAVEYPSKDGPVAGFVAAVRAEDGAASVGVIDEDDILRHDVGALKFISIDDIDDLMPVLRFLDEN